jgi:hypothetical protein
VKATPNIKLLSAAILAKMFQSEHMTIPEWRYWLINPRIAVHNVPTGTFRRGEMQLYAFGFLKPLSFRRMAFAFNPPP